MTDVISLVEDRQHSEFYPTPAKLVARMLDKANWEKVKTVLEPSAGKGDILRGIAKKTKNRYDLEVDAIEIDRNLRSILKYNFSKEAEEKIRNKKEEIASPYGGIRYISKSYSSGKYTYFDRKVREDQYLPDLVQEELEGIDDKLDGFFSSGIHIVHDDFLTYPTYKKYDLIALNPPFSNGDRHLLKALNMQKDGGQIICLLNAETIRNPYTPLRKYLVDLLNKLDAEIEYIESAFTDAERPADVEVALIYVNIPYTDNDGVESIYDRLEKAKEYEEPVSEDCTELTLSDYIKAAVNKYRLEIEAGIELIKTYYRMRPHLQCSLNSDDYGYKTPMLQLTADDNHDVTINGYVKMVRFKYWKALLTNKKFIGKLTSKLQNEYSERINSFSEYEFSEFNIYNLAAEMNTKIKSGIEAEIEVMFDKLTEEHSYYPECKKNRHLYDGWKTNKAWKIDKKCILPVYGVFDSWDGKPRSYEAYGALSDIERILNFFDGNMTADVSLSWQLEGHFNSGITKNIQCKFFNVTFYKKGTVHIVFTCPELINRYNIYMAMRRKWLPPSYGTKSYTEMDNSEQAVIDSFQGKEEYEKILVRPDYYLRSPVADTTPLLIAANI